MRALCSVLSASAVVVLFACGGGGPALKTGNGYQEYECPSPIGRIVREDCSRTALQYEGVSFQGSVGAAGIGASASYRESAVREADALVAMLKEQRVGLCNNFNTCKMSVAEYREDQKQLDDSFVALMALKDRMAQLDAEGASKLLGEIQSLRRGARAKTGPGPATAACPGTSPPLGHPLFSEDFESGADKWITTREPNNRYLTPGAALVLARDPDGSACRSQFQRETLPWGWGHAFTKDPIPVKPGGSYCLSAWIRCSANVAGCLGVTGSKSAWGPVDPQSEWLVCKYGFGGRRGGGLSVPVIADGGWHRYDVPFKAAADQSHLLIQSELWEAGAPGTADFDDIRLYEGDCPK